MANTKKSAKKTISTSISSKKKDKGANLFLARFINFKADHFITWGLAFSLLAIFLLGILLGLLMQKKPTETNNLAKEEYWMVLERGENKEFLYHGVAGDYEKSRLIKEFDVKTGIPGQRPTPLPLFFGKDYWKIVKKYPSYDNPETSPYFLELDIPVEDGVYGPVPYPECNGQCYWEVPGYFGLHGVNGNLAKLSDKDPGSSGCIRHSDDDIAYLYNLLNINEGVRYYINP